MRSKTKKKTFANALEVKDFYFPTHAEKQRREDSGYRPNIGGDLARSLAKRFRTNIQK